MDVLREAEHSAITTEYPALLTDFLSMFSRAEGPQLLSMRPLNAALEHMGYLLEEYLPPVERPNHRDLSTAAYLQIAADFPADRIIVLDLHEFSTLVAAAMRD